MILTLFLLALLIVVKEVRVHPAVHTDGGYDYTHTNAEENEHDLYVKSVLTYNEAVRDSSICTGGILS